MGRWYLISPTLAITDILIGDIKMTNDITKEDMINNMVIDGIKLSDFTTYEMYDYMLNHLSNKEIDILNFAVSVYGLNDETLSNVTYYYYGEDDVMQWIIDSEMNYYE